MAQPERGKAAPNPDKLSPSPIVDSAPSQRGSTRLHQAQDAAACLECGKTSDVVAEKDRAREVISLVKQIARTFIEIESCRQ
ncbi:hypothetical protein KEJ34_06500 [Candidatus Bathyarchaeota archaeon]|nr:hypothetical protein [Candidatus Bathyarchaeota archaeon]